MKKVAKLVIINTDNKYLLLYRSDHPTFGGDPDLPGGILEDGESLLEATLREVSEEVGLDIDAASVRQVYSSTEYSTHGTHYALFVVKLPSNPSITISWEHTAYTWLDRVDFLEKARYAKDTYMHMVYDVLKNL